MMKKNYGIYCASVVFMVALFASCETSDDDVAVQASAENSSSIRYVKCRKTLRSNESYTLDINRDGIADLEIRVSSRMAISTPSSLVTSITITGKSGGGFVAQPYDSGLEITSWDSSVWLGYEDIASLTANFDTGEHTSEQGQWYGVSNKYLIVRARRGSEYNYGWIKMSVASDCNLLIQEYACQLKGDTGLYSGQTK